MEYYSVRRRNVLLSHEKAWRDHKYVSLSDRSQSDKANSVWFLLYDNLEKADGEKNITGYQCLVGGGGDE